MLGWRFRFKEVAGDLLLCCPNFTLKIAYPLMTIMGKLFKRRQQHAHLLPEAIDRLEARHKSNSIGCSAQGCDVLIIQEIGRLREFARRSAFKDGASFSQIIHSVEYGGLWFLRD